MTIYLPDGSPYVEVRPLKLDEVKRQKDAEAAKAEIKQAKTKKTLTLVLDPAKTHILLQPLCKECRHQWVAVFVCEQGRKRMACPRCKRISEFDIRPGNPARDPHAA